MCCIIQSCCCGFKELGPGVFILAILSIIINIGMVVFPWIAFPHLSSGGLDGLIMLLVIADILMAIGAKTGNRGLLVPWLVLYMIYIIITCIAAPLLIYGATFAVDEIRSLSIDDPLANATFQSINNNLPTEERPDIEADTKEFIGKLENDFNNIEYITEERLREVAIAVVSVFVPIYYLYTWIATLSLFKMLSAPQHHQSHGEARYRGQYGRGHAPGLRRPHAKLVAVGLIRSRLAQGQGGHNQVYPHPHQQQQGGGYYAQPQYSPNSPQSAQELPWYMGNVGAGQLPTIYVQEPGDKHARRY